MTAFKILLFGLTEFFRVNLTKDNWEKQSVYVSMFLDIIICGTGILWEIEIT